MPRNTPRGSGWRAKGTRSSFGAVPHRTTSALSRNCRRNFSDGAFSGAGRPRRAGMPSSQTVGRAPAGVIPTWVSTGQRCSEEAQAQRHEGK